jgi:hypothetical protein
MNTRWIRAGRLSGISLILILCFAGCDNPINESGSEGSANTAQEAADNFYIEHNAVLELPADMLVLDDEAPVNAALEAYRSLSAETRALLTAEKAHLDGLKGRLVWLKTSEENGVYYTTTGLLAYLAAQLDNTEDTPYTVVYMGNETAKALYNTLTVGGKYVDLDLSGSGVKVFAYGEEEEGRTFIVSLTLPDSLTETPDGTNAGPIFRDFTNLKTLSAAGLTRLGDSTFYSLAALTTVNLPKAAVIGNYAFAGCSSLAAVNLPHGVTNGTYAFQNCTGLTTVSLPKATAIDNYAFSGCSSLATVNLPEAGTIGQYAFPICTGLTSVCLRKAAAINNFAFQSCNSLAAITLGLVPPTIGTRIFQQAATTVKTITFKAPYTGLYTSAGSPWSDKLGANGGVTNRFWDNNTATRNNLTVALTSL